MFWDYFNDNEDECDDSLRKMKPTKIDLQLMELLRNIDVTKLKFTR
jgi:hypothetical protein